MTVLQLVVAALLLLLGADDVANAAGPDDIRAGMAASRRQDFDEAIRLYTRALEDANLSREDQATAHGNRATVLSRKHEYEQAIADLDAAIALQPDHGYYWYYRGHLAFYLGRFAPAAADLAHSLEIDPRQRYSVIWLHLARAEAGENDADELARNAARTNDKSWPAPVIALYQGKVTPQEFRAAARGGSKAERFAKACETAFYLGAWYREQHLAKQAQRELGDAAKRCPEEWVEHTGAEAMLAWSAR
jgi:lipoprotein NlpI